MRTHVDICDDRLLAVEALLEVKKQVAPYLDLQLVAFPQDGYCRSPTAVGIWSALSILASISSAAFRISSGRWRTARVPVRALCEIAERRGLMVDMHCDETDDPLSRHIETLAAETVRLGLHGRVAGSYLTSMHSMDNYYVSKLLPLIAEAGVHAIPNPLINIVLQGRHDTYPKRRGLTRVKEMREFGINIAFGQDCCMDPWYSLGGADMLDVAHMGLHVGQLTSREAMRFCFDAVTVNPAKVMDIDGYGLEVGCNGDLVVLQARDPIEAVRARRQALCRPTRQGDQRDAGKDRKTVAQAPAAIGRSGRLCAQRHHEFGPLGDRQHIACDCYRVAAR